MEIWAADGRAGLLRTENGRCRRAGPSGGALCFAAGRVYCADRERCATYDAATARPCFSFAVPGDVCALRCFGGMLCALSGDAGSVTGYSLRNGGIVFAAPAGIGPRAMAVSPGGRRLAVAAGAAGAVMLFDEALRRVGSVPVPGEAVGVGFFGQGLIALCAVDEERTAGRLLYLGPGGEKRELLAFPYAPAALCVLPAGPCVVGCDGQLLGLKASGELCFRRSCGYPAVIRPCPRGALICDSLRGEVRLLGGSPLLRTDDLRDALILP